MENLVDGKHFIDMIWLRLIETNRWNIVVVKDPTQTYSACTHCNEGTGDLMNHFWSAEEDIALHHNGQAIHLITG